MKPLSNRNILVCYSGASTFTNTTLEYLESFSSFLETNVYYLHVTHSSIPQIDLNIFDCVLLSYCARLCFPGYVSESFLSKLREYKGVKAVFIQDEYDYVNNEVAALREISPQLVFTCVPKEQVSLIYPKDIFAETEFVQVLTGYVPASLPQLDLKPLHDRPIDIGYRGRDISFRYGKLGDYKYRIGEAFLTNKNTKGLKLDIQMDESSRIYGEKWFTWLSNCKTALGSPSGSNIFDFDGSIAEAFKKAAGNKSRAPESILEKISMLDNQFRMEQISPRVFEATAMGCALIMVKGDYSGILTPGVHYLPVDTDFGNISEVIDCVHDTQLLASIAERAHYDLLASGLYSYKAFASIVREKLDKKISRRMTTVEIPLAPQCVDISANPLNELPSLKPMSLDTFRLKSLLHQINQDYPRLALATAYNALKRRLNQTSLTIKSLRHINVIKTFARISSRMASRS